jgi:heme exporter protein D
MKPLDITKKSLLPHQIATEYEEMGIGGAIVWTVYGIIAIAVIMRIIYVTRFQKRVDAFFRRID